MLTAINQAAPCVLLLDHVDQLLKEQNLRRFLDWSDGSIGSRQDGIFIIGLTSAPSELDPRVLHRPGRFDVQLDIPLPDVSLRKAHCLNEIRRLGENAIDFDSQEYRAATVTDLDSLAAEMAKRTEGGWSYAQLSEVFLSFSIERLALDPLTEQGNNKAVPFQQLLKHLSKSWETIRGKPDPATTGSASSTATSSSSSSSTRRTVIGTRLGRP